VLLDLEMPVMDGYEAARRIKVACPECRIVALTVHGYESARRRARQSGVDEFMIKGAPLESLVAAIARPGFGPGPKE
jgi:DNA-binding NarL/FixJ family response regulator